MSKTHAGLPSTEGPPIMGFVIWPYEVGDIEGKLLTIVESIGLPESQEKAVKGLVRQALWDIVDKPYRDIISGNEVDRAKEQRIGSKSK
jgi:hypothetical protein